MVRLALLLVAALVAWPASVGVANAQAAGPASVAAAHAAAVSRGDLDQVVGLYADDAVRYGATCPPPAGCVGKAAIRNAIAGEIAGHLQVTVKDIQVSGDTAVERAELRNDVSRRLGIDRFLVTVTFVVRGGQIVSFRSVTDTSDPQTASYIAFTQAQAAPTQLPRTGEPGTAAFILMAASASLGGGLFLRRHRRARSD